MNQLGICIVIRDARTLDDIGTCTAPAPVEPGGLVCLEHGPPFRVVSTLPLPPRATVTPVLARPAALAIAAR
jgi:hypothetical protein